MADELRRKALRAEYMSRINRVMDHIERHLADPLNLEELAGVANFSKFHFHRIFSALAGETLNDFIRRIRLERAAVLLADDPAKPVIVVALDCGFSSPAAFARAFRERFGMSASEWRKRGHPSRSKKSQPESKDNQAVRKVGKEPAGTSAYHGGDRNDRKSRIWRSSNMDRKLQVEVKELPELRVAYVRHIGPYQGISRAFEKLLGWAGPRRLLRFPETKLLAVYHDNPDITEEAKLRSSVCVTVPEGTPVGGEIGAMTIPGGLFAVAHFEIGQNEFGDAWQALMGEWFPESGYQPDDRMCYEVYLNDWREHPQKKHIIDICEPVKPL
jgi:AraC family transcriptional regulator